MDKIDESLIEESAKSKEVTKKTWDMDWSLDGRMSAKEYDEKYRKRELALLTIFKDPNDAEKYVEFEFDNLPPTAVHMETES